MRILHVTKKYPYALGGDATCVSNLEREQQIRGHDVFILTTNCREIIDKPNMFRFGLRDSAANWDRVTLKRIVSLVLFFFVSPAVLRRVKPGIIHTHSADLGFLIGIWARWLAIPVVNTCHGVTFPYPFLGIIKRYSEWFFLKFGYFKKVISVDPGSIYFFRHYGLKNYEYVSMLGVDLRAFNMIKDKNRIAGEQEKVIFLFVGRVEFLKGLEYLVTTVLEMKGSFPDFEVWIVGDGPDKDRILKMSNDLKVDGCFRFFGPVTSKEKLIELYLSADILVQPSLWEGFPLTILEAWAAGLAVIATDVGGIRFICKHGVNALVVPARDSNALCAAMKALINDIRLRKELGANGRRLVEEKYTWSAAVDRLEQVYDSLAAKGGVV